MCGATPLLRLSGGSGNAREAKWSRLAEVDGRLRVHVHFRKSDGGHGPVRFPVINGAGVDIGEVPLDLGTARNGGVPDHLEHFSIIVDGFPIPEHVVIGDLLSYGGI